MPNRYTNTKYRHMKHLYTLLFVSIIFLTSCIKKEKVTFSAGSFSLSLNNKGYLTSMKDEESGKNYLAGEIAAPLLSIKVNGKIFPPCRLTKKNNRLTLYYDNAGVTIKIVATEKKSYLKFKVESVSPADTVQLVIWGPYPTTINKTIGETVGVVRDSNYAIGIQSLNMKTLGGYPWRENDCMPQIDIFENKDYSDLSEKGKRYVLYRVEAAKPETFGSTLQAYCRNRNRERIASNLGYKFYTLPEYDDGGVTGSEIALFGCQTEKALDVLGEIETGENLPHPFIDGVWGKKSKTANASYLILAFGVDDIQKALNYTKTAGLKYLYHPSPFKTWGHFLLNKQFPNGIQDLKKCVETAEKQGIHIGVHTLSNFITTNDSYVTPVPDKKLAKVGSGMLTKDLDKNQKEIYIDSPKFFNQPENNSLKTVIIDNELIRYGYVSKTEPWKLMDCQRGAFNTNKEYHKSGAKISLLADHAYKVFLTDAELTKEVAVNLSGLFNKTGLRQLSFDGLEGTQSAGLGNYGEILMVNTWYKHLDERLKQNIIVDASRTNHYFWHIFSRMNWGEPWYAGFRESQTEYRFKNQKYFKRNFIPGMLGWFKMTPETTLEDIEWLLAKAAGYNAGFGLVSSYDTFDKNGLTGTILSQIKLWENARLKGIFDKKTKELLKNVSNEFHLKEINENRLELTLYTIVRFEHKNIEKQPGEPSFSKTEFSNNTPHPQNVVLIISAKGNNIENITLEFDNYKNFKLPFVLHNGDYIKYYGTGKALLFDKNNKLTNSVETEKFVVNTGNHSVAIDCKFTDGNPGSKLKTEIRLPQKRIIL